jgi:Uma2 family endonuclease
MPSILNPLAEMPALPAGCSFTFVPEEPLSDDAFFDFCQRNRHVQIERVPSGEVIVMAPSGGESGFQSGEVFAQLAAWARGGRGRAFDSSTLFELPTAAALSPDAAWVSRDRIEAIPKPLRARFLSLCPEFVVEVKSPSDRLRALQWKMEAYVAAGAQLAWLIDPSARTVWIYRPGAEPEARVDISSLEGEGPVAGFVLQLEEIWKGL